MRTTLTKTELRQFFREDTCFLWFKAIIQEKFSEEKLLLGASSSDRLWQIKGMNEVLHYIKDPVILLDMIDDEDLDES